MSRLKSLFIVIGLMLLTACAPAALSPTPVVKANPSPYDGLWIGTGAAQDGRAITVKFNVQNGAISSFLYTYPREGTIYCTGIDHSVISFDAQPKIISSKFSQVFGSDLTADATFNSDTTAAGHISIFWQGRTNCNASLQAAWTATKQQAAQTNIVAPVTIAWCGKNVDCGGLLIQLLIFGLVNGAILALNAIGVTVIYSTVRTLNLAHGDVFAMTTSLVTSIINFVGINQNWNPATRIFSLAGVLLASILFGALLSVGVEELAFRPFRGRSKLAPLIASLGISFILYQGSLVWRTMQASFIRGEHRSVPGLPEVPTDGIPNLLPLGNLLPGKVVLQFSDVFVFVAAILFVLVTTYILQKTKIGRAIRAVAQNEELAQIVGVPRDGAAMRAFALGGALAGAAGFVFALYYSRPFGQAGAQSGLFAFAAALLGGIGSPIGALISGLTLGVVGSFSDYFFTASWTPVLLLGLLTALLVWRRGGFGGDSLTDETAARDSVVLTAPVSNPKVKRLLIALIILLIPLPILLSVFGIGGQSLLTGIGVFILLTLGLNLLLGLAGVLDLGYAMSFAIGGYAAALLRLDFIFVVLMSAVFAGLFGFLKGKFAERLRGDYLAVATLALGLMTQQMIVNARTVTGGMNGLSALPAPHLFGFVVASPSAQVYLVFGFVLLAALASGRLISSRTGRAWIASSEDETAAISFGIDTANYRVLAFVLSSALAGIAGALYAATYGYIDPDIAAFYVSAMLLSMVILGGAGSVGGAVLGTVLIYSYDKVIVGQVAALLALLWPQGVYIGMVPDIRGTNFFNFGLALYLTVLWRARKK
jgi:branched-chain amino acid transport system permease protein